VGLNVKEIVSAFSANRLRCILDYLKWEISNLISRLNANKDIPSALEAVKRLVAEVYDAR